MKCKMNGCIEMFESKEEFRKHRTSVHGEDWGGTKKLEKSVEGPVEEKPAAEKTGG